MCFYNDDDPAEVWRQQIVVGRKQHKCKSCRRVIEPGEQQLSIFYVYEGEPGKFRICNQCCQDREAIHRHEMRVGCRWDESWCRWSDVRRLMLRGNEDEQHIEFEGDEEDDRVCLFWPYGVPPAAKPIDLKQMPDLARV